MKILPFEYAVRNLGRSPRRLIAGVIGSALVSLLVLAASAFVRGMEHSLGAEGPSQNVMLLGAGSEDSVERSQISGAAADIATASIAGIRSRLGVRYVSPEIHMVLVAQAARGAAGKTTALFRGVTPAAFLVHAQVRVVEGRAPQAGREELLVGRMVWARLGVSPDQVAVGRELWIDDRAWKIVGSFEAPGTVMESEIWTPLSDLRVVTKNEMLSCVVLTLDDAEFADVAAFAKQRLDLELVAMREADYYARLLDFFGPIRALVWATAGLIALGGLFGGLNTMYAAFATRVRELGALQALGYSRRALVLSLVQESVLLTAVGGLLAAGAGVWLLDGVAVRFSLGAFGLNVDTTAVATALGAALALGAIGALPPAYRCLRLPITDALRTA